MFRLEWLKPMSEQILMAGRELDALVAEKVMGWTNVQANAFTPYGQDACGTPPDGIKPMWNSGRSAIPRYSTDIAAAWQVWETLRQSGRWCCLELSSDYDICWTAQLTPAETREGAPHVPTVVIDDAAYTAAETICHAALRAIALATP